MGSSATFIEAAFFNFFPVLASLDSVFARGTDCRLLFWLLTDSLEGSFFSRERLLLPSSEISRRAFSISSSSLRVADNDFLLLLRCFFFASGAVAGMAAATTSFSLSESCDRLLTNCSMSSVVIP